MQSSPHAKDFVAHPFAILAGAFAIGILTSRYLIPQLWLVLPLAALLYVLAIGSFIRQWHVLATIFIALSFVFVGASSTSLGQRKVLTSGLRRLLEQGRIIAGDAVEVEGVITAPPETAPGRLYLTLRVEQIRFHGETTKCSGLIALTAPTGAQTEAEFKLLNLRYGSRVRVMTTVHRAEEFRNPGVSSLTEYLERQGYDAAGLVKSPLLIERLNDQFVFVPLSWLYDWRQKVEDQIRAHFNSETAGVLIATLLGNRHYLTATSAERFRQGGTFHVLVISGLHISFIGGLVFLIARKFTRNRALRFVVSATVIWSYALAVGAQAAVIRAALMFTLVAFAPVVHRRSASLNALGVAGLALLVRHPHDLFDPSFQLTFLSVLAIVVFAWPILFKLAAIGSWRPTRETPRPATCARGLRAFCECLFWSERQWRQEINRSNYSCKLFKAPLAGVLERYRLQRVMSNSFAAFVVSLSVQLTLLPLLILYFHRLSIASLILNICVSLLMALLSLIAIVGLLLTQLSPLLAEPLFRLANALNWVMVHSVDPFLRLGIASVRLPEYSGGSYIIYVLYYPPLLVLAVLLSRWNPLASLGPRESRSETNLRRLALLAQTATLAMIVWHPFSARLPDRKLYVDFLDVGQGDAALVTMPNGSTLLVDGGGRPNFFDSPDSSDENVFARETRSIGEVVVSEYLWWRGLDHVDYILATHADADHIAGLSDVARNFRVRAALVARHPEEDPEYRKFANVMQKEGIPVCIVGAGDVFHFGDVTVKVLWPLAEAKANAPSRNNDSLVLHLKFGNRTVLLTGDIEAGAETALVNGYEDLRADVVKVAHHGSKTSSTAQFVTATQAQVAVVSVGQTSIFGHPNPEVVARWQASGAKVLTTGLSGNISLITDGQNLELRTFVP